MKVYKTAGGKSYKFEPHALNRMARRRIKREDVEYALDNYHTCHNDRKGNPCFVATLEDERRLRVVVASDTDPMEIITVIVLD